MLDGYIYTRPGIEVLQNVWDISQLQHIFATHYCFTVHLVLNNMPDQEEGYEGYESSPDSIQTNQTHDQSEDRVQSQKTGNGSLSSMQHLLPTESDESSLAGTLRELKTGWVTVEGKRHQLSFEEIQYQGVSR